MKKKTWGIILLVLAGMGLLGGIANGTFANSGIVELIGFCAAIGLCAFFGFKFTKQG